MKNIHLNILSLLNVGLGFIFIIMLGRKLGLGEQTDIYFFALIVVAYLEQFVGIIWVAIKHYYAELKIDNNEYLNRVYIILLNSIIAFSLFIIALYFLITSFFDIFSAEVKSFLDVYIYFVLIHSLLTYNKKILNLEHHYASVYLVDIFVYSVNLVTVMFFMKSEVLILAYSSILSSALVVLWQLRQIFHKNNFRYEIIFYEKDVIKEIFKNSFKLNISSVLYNFKDIIIAASFAGSSNGTYSLFSYASKFVGAVSTIVTGPIENVYAAKISYIMAKKDFKLAIITVKKLLLKTSSLFSIAASITYFCLPYILEVMMGNKITDSQIDTIQFIFILLSFYYLLKAIELPYGKILYLLKFFNFGISINVIYLFIALAGYFAVKAANLSYEYILLFIIVGQIFKLLISIYKYKYSFVKNYFGSGIN